MDEEVKTLFDHNATEFVTGYIGGALATPGVSMNIIEHSDEKILQVAHSMWRDLLTYSNKGQYGKFIRNFSYDLLIGLNEIEVGKQFAKSGLARNLSEEWDYLGIIRRGEHVTVLYRVRSTKKEGEWLGRLVLGYEKSEIRIFGASIF
jgi:hypothetical protein